MKTEKTSIRLGIEIRNIQTSYYYESLIKFLKGEENECMYFDHLKPLYDEYGYKEVNKAILEFDAEVLPNE